MVFYVYEIQDLLIAAKQKQSGDAIILELRNQLSLLTEKINAYEIIAKEFLGKDSLNADIKAIFRLQIGTMKQQRSILENDIATLKKDVRRWKRKTRWTAVAGVVATAAVAYLYISK